MDIYFDFLDIYCVIANESSFNLRGTKKLNVLECV